MKIEKQHVYGIMDALRGMRNPLNSWERGDSSCICDQSDGHVISVTLGENDRKLCTALNIGGSPHRKYLRQIFITMDITAPSYWWAEMDTYKASTTRNSCSIQHKGASRDFEISDFTLDSIEKDANVGNKLTDEEKQEELDDMLEIINIVNKWRQKYTNGEKSNYDYFRAMRQFLPMGYNYKATWSGNYENLLNIYEWRKNHKLSEWRIFTSEVEKLPLMDIFLKLDNGD